MPAGPKIPDEFVRFAKQIVFGLFFVGNLITVILLISWLLLLLSFIGISHWPASPTVDHLILYFCLSFAMLCAILWLGSQIEIVNLKESAQKTIGRSFVVLVLGAVVTAFKSALHH